MSKTPKDFTKKYTKLYRLYFSLSIILLVAPILAYAIMGFVDGSAREKFRLGMTLIVAGILTLVNLIFKFHIRSVIWIVVLGIYFCVDNIAPLLLTVSISTILDEFILTPLYKKYRAKSKINREIDKRLEDARRER